MQSSIPQLEKRAVSLALEGNWEEALTTNKEIIELNPEDTKARIRLGRAYLQLKKFSQAEKIFKEILKLDPINTVVQKNLELAKSKKTEQPNKDAIKVQKQLKEPGTSKEADALIDAKGVTARTFNFGAEFGLKINKTFVGLIYKDKIIGKITDESIVKRLNFAKENGITAEASFRKGIDKDIKVLITTSRPVFKGEKQDIKPYMKKGTIEEPEIEIEKFDDDE